MCKRCEHREPRSRDFSFKKSHYRQAGFQGLLQQWLYSHAQHSVSLTRRPTSKPYAAQTKERWERRGARGRGSGAFVSKRNKINRAATNMRNKERGGTAPAGGIQRNSFLTQYPCWQNAAPPPPNPATLPLNRPGDEIPKYFPCVVIILYDRFAAQNRGPGVRLRNK